MNALEAGSAVPDPPQLGPGDLSTWIQVIKNQEHRHRESEAALMSIETKMKDHEAYIGRLTQQLQVSIAETKTAQESLQLTRHEVDEYKEILAHVAELAGEVVRHDVQVRAAANELLSKSSQLNTLTGSFKDLAESLRSASSKSPAK
jgi:chromosome segregation ATPase